MKLTLVRTYKNGDVVNIFSEEQARMDEFIIEKFKNKEALESYFCEMKKNVLEDGQIDYGEFKLLSINKDCSNIEIEELPLLFGEDLENLKLQLQSSLLKNDEFISDLLFLKPELFGGSLSERTLISLNGLTPYTIHERNIRTLENSLFNGNLKRNFRAINNLAITYTEKEKVQKIKVLEEQ